MKRYKFLSAALLGALLTMGTVTSCSDSGYLDINLSLIHISEPTRPY